MADNFIHTGGDGLLVTVGPHQHALKGRRSAHECDALQRGVVRPHRSLRRSALPKNHILRRDTPSGVSGVFSVPPVVGSHLCISCTPRCAEPPERGGPGRAPVVAPFRCSIKLLVSSRSLETPTKVRLRPGLYHAWPHILLRTQNPLQDRRELSIIGKSMWGDIFMYICMKSLPHNRY